MNQNVTLAVAKGGRILSAQLELLAKIGVEPLDDMKTSRKLIFDTNRENLQLVLLRGADVATYVEHGIADLGMTGKDSLLEHGEEGYYQPLDLKIGQCRIMVAGLRDELPLPSRLKIATKYEKTAKQFYAEKGIQVDVIKLYGAMELAPITGLAHRIVDIVETGNTLKANGLVTLEHITDISTQLIVNKVSMKMKHRKMQNMIDELSAVVGE
ncbi:ATP phosphoribosyltransferase [Pseudomonadales bacterium]|nr:ATP phosphoribosyltransferase [Gammaproteobacteria bacterium]MDA8879626.1 ATP phosphoribosyltransferase [Pseudomonadales bacterium]MDC1017114.1 ATP phosphoribosyltransferase [Pseudomonadales bacterium]MDC1479619.1 ATP phosphoribosyltransferase [Pseudomonadales bacterium]